MPPVQRSGAAEKTIIANNSNTNNGTIIGRSTSRSTTTAAAVAGTAASSVNKQSNLSSLGDASGVAILLGNHAKFGFAERCCYHFDLIETLTSLPTGRIQHARIRRGRERGLSITSQDGPAAVNNTENNTSSQGEASEKGGAGKQEEGKPSHMNNRGKSSSDMTKSHCLCGVVSLLECVAGGTQSDRTTKRTLRSKIREFNTRAQASWGRSTRGTGSGSLKRKNTLGSSATPRQCHQPRHLPLPLNPSTRVSFAYELTSMAIVLDASPSLTSTFGISSDFGGFGEEKSNMHPMNECVPLDRLGPLIKSYLKGLIQPIEVPPVAVSGMGVAFGRWTPNLAITVVAAYPPTSKGDRPSAGLLVRDFRVSDESSALELALQIERWALREVESVIAERLCGGRDFCGDGVAGRGDRHYQMSSLGSFSLPSKHIMGSWANVKSSMKDIMAVGGAALSTLPSEGRPVILVASDCNNVHSGGVFDSLSETSRSDVPVSILNLSSVATPNASLAETESIDIEFSRLPSSVSDDSQSLRDACHLSGGIFLHPTLLDSYVMTTVGSQMTPSSPLHGDYHFSFKKRSIKPNALQWYTLFSLSPFTPGRSSAHWRPRNPARSSSFYRANSIMSFSSSANSTKQLWGKPPMATNPASLSSMYDPRTKVFGSGIDASPPKERISFAKYNIQPIRIKSLLMSRVLEGYHARKYGHNTQDSDKVSVHLVLPLADCGVLLHYEASFVSSPYHVPFVGQAHIKLELSCDDSEFISIVKKAFLNHGTDSLMLQGRRISPTVKATAEKICKLLRWTRKEDYLESYLCLPGWGTIQHLSSGSPFLTRLGTLTQLQRFRHFRSETIEVVTIGGHFHEKSESIFSHLENNDGEEELFLSISSWSSGIISDRSMYFKELVPSQDNDLAYYCITRVVQSPSVSRLFTITTDFHGELNCEQRLAIVSSLQDCLRGCQDIILLEKCISSNVAIRPESPSLPWEPVTWNEYFLHHKCWELLQEKEVLELICKRRHEIGNFFILHSSEHRAVFAKFVTSHEDNSVSLRGKDTVLYQVLSHPDGMIVDIYQEATQSIFNPYHARHSNTRFASIYEKVKRRDKDCAKNVRSRTNLLEVLNHSEGKTDVTPYNPTTNQAENVSRLIRLSTMYRKKLRFFNEEGSGAANDILTQFTTESIVSDSVHTQAAKLLIDLDKTISGHTGSWFIMRVDWYVLSIVCLENDQVQDADDCRHLSFFTAGTLDLYQSDEDIELDDSSDSASEHTPTFDGVSDIALEIESIHAKNFAKACYEALRDTNNPVNSLRLEEVDYALQSCIFKEILLTSVSVDDISAHLSSSAQTMTGAKLAAVIGTLLQVVPGSHNYVFYYHGDDLDISDESSVIDNAHNDQSDDEFMVGDAQAFSVEEDIPDDMQSIKDEGSILNHHQGSESPPLFFRLALDQDLVNLDGILAIKKSATLSAQVSVFESSGTKLPQSHAAVVSKLQSALNSFSSEQTLEKYRYLGRGLTEEDFKVVMRNVVGARHRSLEIPLTFFISRSNTLIAASTPSGSKQDLDHAFTVLMNQLEKSVSTVRASQESFLVLDEEASRDVLPYWCFIQIRRETGLVIVRVYHPLGDVAAEKKAQATRVLVEQTCDRTNQLLLLDSLYTTKNASPLLISEEEEQTDKDGESARYSCPVKYTTTIPLHRRCAPNQAILALETTILQNFIISNRRGPFVYKDEENNVFYLKLNSKLNSYKISGADEMEQNPHIIELLVYGCNAPGPSITDQLVCLLRRKLLTITLDALSSLLKKNPWFNLLASDLAFINGFGSALSRLDHESSLAPAARREYILPPNVKDPLLLMLMFRQNICGSTFIQALHHEETYTDDRESIQVDEGEQNTETIDWKRSMSEFLFYFNSSPSQIDPSLMTTLTERGRQYSQQAGSGISIIEVNLQLGEESEFQVKMGSNGVTSNSQKLRVETEDISLRSFRQNNEQFKIIVTITNTTVDIDVIHKWVELSISQVLAAWSIEGHLESSCLGLLHGYRGKPKTRDESRLISINKAVPGLTALEDMLRMANELPHPAVFHIQSKGLMRATALAQLTLGLLEAMLTIVHKKVISKGINIIRVFSQSGGASIVKIVRDKKQGAQVSRNGKIVFDKSTDSPEYIVVFGLNDESRKSAIDSPQNLFFKSVILSTSGDTEFSQAVSRISTAKPALFQRHLVFVIRVSRSTRSLMTYNASPQIRTKMELKFKEVEQDATKSYERSLSDLQSRCCHHISFIPNDTFTQVKTDSSKGPPEIKSQEKKQVKEEPVVKRGPARRIPRPTSMLRPTLIGKSVEGSAQQALAASRLRASTRPNIAQRTASAGSKKKVSVTPQREKAKEQAIPQERRAPGSQKKISRETATKDTASIVRSSHPQASLLKTYRHFISLLKVGGPDLWASSARLNQASLQHLSHMYLVSSKDKGYSLASARLIASCYSNCISTGSIKQLRCDDNNSAKAFLDHIIKRWGAKKFVPMGGTDSHSTHSHQLYLKKDLLSSSTKKAVIMMELVLEYAHNAIVLHYRAWLINTVDNTKSDKLRRKRAASSMKIEREAAFIEAIALDFMGHLYIDRELFDFGCLRVSRMARGTKRGNGPTALPLLKSIISRYDPKSQAQLPFPGYRLQRRFLAPSTFLEGPLLDLCKKRILAEHLLSHCTMYGLICNGAGADSCLAGKLHVAGFLVYYVIGCHETVESALDVFVLCLTKGQCIDSYITKKGAPIAERISDVVLHTAMAHVQELIEKATKNIRKSHLWKIFGLDYSPSLSSKVNVMDSVAELRTYSGQLDLVLVDSRLQLLLRDEDELQLSWRDAFKAITRTPSFSHCISFNKETTSTYLICDKDEDVFIDFVLDEQGRVQQAQVLVRDIINNAARSTVQKFTRFLLQWMWIDCEIAM